MPQGYEFLLGFSETVSQPELMMSEYLGLTSKLLIGFGIIFQLPVVTSFMAKVGLITHRHLITYWRHSVVASFIVAAILTPPDVITQVLMALPLSVLYFLSIGVAWYFTRQNERKAARESAMSET
jgi:sec-independent protein translocase protein TatC